jgi:hypothetical protein
VCFFVGPSSIAYLLLLLFGYLFYTRAYLAGISVADVKTAFSAWANGVHDKPRKSATKR